MLRLNTVASALTLLALVPTAARAQSVAPSEFPVVMQQTEYGQPAHSSWVPVFMLGDSDARLSADPLTTDTNGSVLLGIAHVRREYFGGAESSSVSPELRWHIDEQIHLGASMTVTEFIPCRSLMQSPLAPVQAACESFTQPAANTGVGVEGSLSFGSGSLHLGYSESPAIWVVPGASALQNPVGLGFASPAVPMAPLGALANETARTFSVGGELELNARSRIGVELALSQIPRLENSPDIGRVQFSLAYGDFSADMATKMIRQGMESVSPWWGGMDLGVSWRTPWSGVISLGARNLVTTGDPPQLGDTPRAEVSESDAFSRTPYVRYEQDF
jgi:hypothetical protein